MSRLFLFAALLLAACGSPDAPASDAAANASVASASAELPAMTVYKTPTCGCCSVWAERMAEAGFPVETVDVADLTQTKQALGIPAGAASCHTAVVDGYAVEGHVPADDVKRLLAERPDAIGLAVPGMPIGSPGMEVPGRGADAYDVLLVRRGETSVYSSYAATPAPTP
jgi:hypothetical protein